MSEDKKLKILLAYILGWVSGLILYLVEKEDKEIRKHALQSIIIFGSITILGMVLSVLSFVSIFFKLFSAILNIVSTVLWIYFIVTAILGKAEILPFLKNFIESKV